MRQALAALFLIMVAACSPQMQAPKTDARLDPLFAQLHDAPDAATAAQVEAQIWNIWGQSGSATVDILLERAEAAEAVGDVERARGFLDSAVEILPTYAEAFNRRAVLAFDINDTEAALEDIDETLKREPRHFGALAGLGMIYESMGQKRAALEAYRAALEIHPFLEEAKQGAARLGAAYEGRNI